MWGERRLESWGSHPITDPYKTYPIVINLEKLEPDTTYYYFFGFGNQTYELPVLFENRHYPY